MSDDYREYRGDFPHEMSDDFVEYLELLKKRSKEAADEAAEKEATGDDYTAWDDESWDERWKGAAVAWLLGPDSCIANGISRWDQARYIVTTRDGEYEIDSTIRCEEDAEEVAAKLNESFRHMTASLFGMDVDEFEATRVSFMAREASRVDTKVQDNAHLNLPKCLTDTRLHTGLLNQASLDGHPSRDDVDKFMYHIKKAMSVRLEAERLSQGYLHSRTALQAQMEGARLRRESEIAFTQAEYMAYELIDTAVDRNKN